MTDAATEALKPCPFCGEEPSLLFSHEWGREDVWAVHCNKCDIDFSGHGFTTPEAKTSAAAIWNTRALSTPTPAGELREVESFQTRVQPWLLACFGELIAGDREERNHRFLEEALELVQACGCTAHEAHQLVDYTFGRPMGEPSQEVGGVMVTLAALCLANGLDMHSNGETELARIWTKVEKIRAKQAAKPKHSPLPEHVRALAQLGSGEGV